MRTPLAPTPEAEAKMKRPASKAVAPVPAALPPFEQLVHDGRAAQLPFVCLDDRLNEAADREGFPIELS